MLVDTRVAIARHAQIEICMSGDLLEHVIEESDSRAHFRIGRSIKVHANSDARLLGVSGHRPDARRSAQRMGNIRP
jgi:hypothetical protein